MGCDIHVHVEFKIRGKWLHYNRPNVNRNYALFAAMAGVRAFEDSDPPIAEPRGIPKNATETTKFDFKRYGEDAHTPSWLSCKEMAVLEKQAAEFYGEKAGPWDMARDFGWFFGGSFSGFTEYPNDRPAGVQDVRVVFWFDN